MTRYKPGKCSSCGGEPVPGKSTCQKCLDRRKLSRARKQPGICIQCPRPAVPGKSRCTEHLIASTQIQLLKKQNNLSQGLCRCGSKPKDGCTNCQACINKSTIRRRNQMVKLRTEIFDHYGNKCACCGIDIPEFLTIDHINGDGYKENKHGITLYRWVIKHGFPKTIQILCWNCNCAKRNNVICPHQNHQEELLTSKKQSFYKLRAKVLDAYGNRCVCCGESGKQFLNLDHTNGDGAVHRKHIRQTATSTIYRWAIINNFPDTLRILCWNCNISRSIYGVCPHQIGKVHG